MKKKPSILVLGLRAFPFVQGGVETHAQFLFSEIAAKGYRVLAVIRSPYVRKDHPEEWNGVKFIKLWTLRQKSLETITHTFLGILYAAFLRPDILHIQAIGPSVFTPLARLFGLKVVVTHHGADYERQKWGLLARTVLKLGERWGMRFSHRRIVISKTIHDHVLKKYGIESTIIPNGIEPPHPQPHNAETLDAFGLQPQKYILMVSRFVPEKRQSDLVQAFKKANLFDWKLVLVGAADHETPYSRSLSELANATPNVVITGFQCGEALKQLYSNAGLFVLPSSHEGLPIVLLEALSYGLPPIVSDIDAHKEIALPQEHYFKTGDCDNLATRLLEFSQRNFDENWRSRMRQWVVDNYNWENAAQKTTDVYKNLLDSD